MLNDISYIAAEKELQLLVITMRVFYAYAIEERKRVGRFNSHIFSLPSFSLIDV
jgi:hypothetical protein